MVGVGIVAECIPFSIIADRYAEIPCRSHTIVFRPAPGLGKPVGVVRRVRADVRYAGVDCGLPVGGLESTTQLFVVHDFDTHVGESVVAQPHTEVASNFDRYFTFVELAVLYLNLSTFVCVLEEEIYDAGDGVRTVLGCGAVTKDLNIFECDRRDRSHIGRMCAGAHRCAKVLYQSGSVTAFGVHQQQ